MQCAPLSSLVNGKVLSPPMALRIEKTWVSMDSALRIQASYDSHARAIAFERYHAAFAGGFDCNILELLLKRFQTPFLPVAGHEALPYPKRCRRLEVERWDRSLTLNVKEETQAPLEALARGRPAHPSSCAGQTLKGYVDWPRPQGRQDHGSAPTRRRWRPCERSGERRRSWTAIRRSTQQDENSLRAIRKSVVYPERQDCSPGMNRSRGETRCCSHRGFDRAPQEYLERSKPQDPPPAHVLLPRIPQRRLRPNADR